MAARASTTSYTCVLFVGLLSCGILSMKDRSEEVHMGRRRLQRNGSEERQPWFVRKTVFSDDVRIGFLAGIEGTGHHMWDQIFTRAKRDGIVTTNCTLTATWFKFESDVTRKNPSTQREDSGALATTVSPERYDMARLLATELMRELGGSPPGPDSATVKVAPGAAEATQVSPMVAPKIVAATERAKNSNGGGCGSESDGDGARCGSGNGGGGGGGGSSSGGNGPAAGRQPSLVAINPNHLCKGSDQLSFPSFFGADKPLQHVDVRLLARVAEEAGADLRVLLLHRDAGDALRSTVRRGFGTPMHQARVLLINARALHAML
ncbi:unnamed protein product, partial [Phaeothamnion confervicola]